MVLALGHLAWVATRMRLSDGVDPSLGNLAQGGSRRASTIPSSPPARKPFYTVNLPRLLWRPVDEKAHKGRPGASGKRTLKDIAVPVCR